MSIQSFTEEVLKKFDESFSDEANKLLNAARQMEGTTPYLAGRMDGLTKAVEIIKQTYSLFVVEKNEKEEDESKPLY